jgi:hypothetical protein
MLMSLVGWGSRYPGPKLRFHVLPNSPTEPTIPDPKDPIGNLKLEELAYANYAGRA